MQKPNRKKNSAIYRQQKSIFRRRSFSLHLLFISNGKSQYNNYIAETQSQLLQQIATKRSQLFLPMIKVFFPCFFLKLCHSSFKNINTKRILLNRICYSQIGMDRLTISPCRRHLKATKSKSRFRR